MASWAARRQMTFLGFGLTLFLLIFIVPLFFVFYQAPTCTDGAQNQNETGIDCGGACPKLCKANVAPPVILWSRSFKVSDGVYNAITYVTNPNINSAVYQAAYQLKLYDRDNVLLAERKGITSIPPGTTFPVFEGGVVTGSLIPAKTFFEFVGVLSWDKRERDTRILSVVNRRFNESERKLEADILNSATYPVANVLVTAVLFDALENALTGSQTVIDRIPAQQSAPIIFTWPEAIPGAVAKIDIIPQLPLEPKN